MTNNIIHKRFFLLVCLCTALCTKAIAQIGVIPPERSNDHSLITMKTTRALFPHIPVSIANEIHGGLHVVGTVKELHGNDGNMKLYDGLLQKGMIVWVDEKQMYYIYQGPQDNGGTLSWNDASNSTSIVNTNFWKPLTWLIPTLLENVTVISNCSRNYTLDLATGNLDKDGNNNRVQIPFSGENQPGDHLILMPATGTKPLAVYVWDGDDSADNNKKGSGRWTLISLATIVFAEGDTQQWNYDPQTGEMQDDNGDPIPAAQDVNEGDMAIVDGKTYVYDGDKWNEINDKDQAEVIFTNPFIAPQSKVGYDIGAMKKLVDPVDTNCFVVYLLAEVPSKIDESGTKWVEITRSVTEKNVGHIMGLRSITQISATSINLDDCVKFELNNTNLFEQIPEVDVVLSFPSEPNGEYFAFAVPSGWTTPKIFGHFGAHAMDFYELHDCWHKKVVVIGHVEYQIFVMDKKLPSHYLQGGVDFCIE